MNTTFPLTIYFDASCALCNSEMQCIKRLDAESRLTLVDCSAPGFDDRAFHAEGITRDTMMNCLHAQDADGKWLKGVAAFEVIYRAVDMAMIANLWGHPAIRPVAERAYPWIVKHRHLLSALGVHKVFGLSTRIAAYKANLRSQACKAGQCAISDK